MNPFLIANIAQTGLNLLGSAGKTDWAGAPLKGIIPEPFYSSNRTNIAGKSMISDGLVNSKKTAASAGQSAGQGFDWLSFGINNIGNLYSLGNSIFNKEKEKRVQNPFMKQSLDIMKNMSYNVNPQLAENRNTLGYGRQALTAAAGGNAASYLSGLRGMLTQKYMSDAGAYAMKQNMDNQYQTNYAQALNQAGEMERAEGIRYNTANLQNSARRQDMTANSLSQMGQNYQMQKNDQIRMNLLPYMFPGFTWNNMTK